VAPPFLGYFFMASSLCQNFLIFIGNFFIFFNCLILKKFKFTLVLYFLSLCLWSFFFHFSFCFSIYFCILIKKIAMSTLTWWEKLIKDIKMNMLIVERIKIKFWILDSFEKTLKMTRMHQKYNFRVFYCFSFCYI